MKRPEAVEESIREWVERKEPTTLVRDTPLSAVTDPPVHQMPGPFAGLNDDQIWTVQNLIEILKQEPQGAIFRSLDLTLQLAITEYRKSRSAHETPAKKAARESPQPAHRKPTGTGRHH
jgi:hypothetical protein